MNRPVIIANCSGFFGDRISAAREMVEGGPIDVRLLKARSASLHWEGMFTRSRGFDSSI